MTALKDPIVSDTEAYGEIGQLLRHARTQMRMPVEQASRMLHIRVRYLEALEEGRLTELPGLTYTRGYLQAYAVFLGLDKDEILRRFEQIEEILARKGFYFPQVFSKEKAPSNWMVWGGLGAAVAIYLIWIVFIHPGAAPVSLVEKLPPPREKVHISSDTARDVACLQEPDVLYPPCTMARDEELNPPAIFGYHLSVMDYSPVAHKKEKESKESSEAEPADEPESH